MRVFYGKCQQLNMVTKQVKQKSKQSATKTKQKTPERWKWDNVKTEKFLAAAVQGRQSVLKSEGDRLENEEVGDMLP